MGFKEGECGFDDLSCIREGGEAREESESELMTERSLLNLIQAKH